jgi:L-aspartate oxidase
MQVDAPRSVLASLAPDAAQMQAGVVVVGGGVTGLMAALQAAKHTAVLLLTRDTLRQTNSAWAQGGIAAAIDEADSPALHVEDTLTAGAGLSDRAAVEKLTSHAPRLMHLLAEMGVPFEREAGRFALGLEGSHSHRRILHVGDTTGWAITSTLMQRVRESPNIRVLEGYQAVDLLREGESCRGVLACDQGGKLCRVYASATILATGGASALYGLSSNQPGAVGEGIALAYRAGAAVTDMEFVQFHPTVLHTRSGSGFLISEAVRGEGARLLTPRGERFMPAFDPRAELAPRDVVTRAIFEVMQREDSGHVLLDLSHLSEDYVRHRFPTISERCRAEGFNPPADPIPVAPASHYLMGGICTDHSGATTLPGLYAAGECACTGVHGANRLASNSLLECLVFGSAAGHAAATSNQQQGIEIEQGTQRLVGQTQPPAETQHARHSGQSSAAWRSKLADIMRTYAGPLRAAAGAAEGLQSLAAFPMQVALPASTLHPETLMAANAALVARLVLAGALARTESRGAHYRHDFPQTDNSSWRAHLVWERGRAACTVETVADITTLRTTTENAESVLPEQPADTLERSIYGSVKRRYPHHCRTCAA